MHFVFCEVKSTLYLLKVQKWYISLLAFPQYFSHFAFISSTYFFYTSRYCTVIEEPVGPKFRPIKIQEILIGNRFT